MLRKPFNGYEQGPDFDRARSMIATPFQYIDVALDVAGSNQVFNVSGDFLYVDAISTGQATLELNNQYNDPSAPFQISAGFGLQALFKQLKLTWAAQAGKRLRLMYSTGDKVVPTNSTTISGSVSVNNSGFEYTGNYKSIIAKGGNVSDQIVAPAANVNGLVLWSASFSSETVVVAFHYACILAKNAAPATVIDGDVIVSPINSTTRNANYGTDGQLLAPVKIAAGLGLYFIATNAESNTFRSALYTLL